MGARQSAKSSMLSLCDTTILQLTLKHNPHTRSLRWRQHMTKTQRPHGHVQKTRPDRHMDHCEALDMSATILIDDQEINPGLAHMEKERSERTPKTMRMRKQEARHMKRPPTMSKVKCCSIIGLSWRNLASTNVCLSRAFPLAQCHKSLRELHDPSHHRLHSSSPRSAPKFSSELWKMHIHVLCDCFPCPFSANGSSSSIEDKQLWEANCLIT